MNQLAEISDFFSFYRFSDKTKNEWSGRKKFKKVAGKYDMVQLDYGAKVREETVLPVLAFMLQLVVLI